MVKKPTISNISSGYASTTTLNSNFTALRDAFDNTLSLDGSLPNSMETDFDLNSNDVLNVDKGYFRSVYIGGELLTTTSLTSLSGTRQFATVTDMKASTDVTVGQVVFVAGYSTIGDGGHGHYVKVSSEPSHEGKEENTGASYASGGWFEILYGEVISVCRFGGKGDGTTDSTTAINNAILYAEDTGVGTVSIPRGSSYWYTTGTINMKSGVKLVMEGANSRDWAPNYIRPSSAVTEAFVSDTLNGLIVEGLAIDMQDMPANSIGIKNTSCWHDTWNNCTVFGNTESTSIGWKITASSSRGNYWARYVDCESISRNDVGIGWSIEGQSVGATKLTTLLFINCISNENSVGFDIDYTGSGVRFIGGSVEANASDGINVANLAGGTQINMSDMEIGSNGGYDINCATGSMVTVDNMVLLGSGTGTINGPVGWREGNGMRPNETYSYWGADRFYTNPNNQTMTEAGGNIATAIGSSDEFTTVKTDGNPGTITANPAIATPPLDLEGGERGMLKIVRGGSNTATVTIPDGNGVRLLNDSPIPLGLDDIQIFYYDANQATDWVEIGRWIKTDGPWTLSNISTDRSINTSDISGLTFSASPTQAECEALRDAVAGLANSVGTLIGDIKTQGLAR